MPAVEPWSDTDIIVEFDVIDMIVEVCVFIADPQALCCK